MVKFVKKLLGVFNHPYSKEQRIQRFPLDIQGLIGILHHLRQGRLVSIEGLPADAKAVGVTKSLDHPNRLFIFLESKKFPVVRPEQAIPNMDPITIHVKVPDNARNND